ncbi:hypothetical protein MNEG_5543 [Monoraphidium neglectum]|uniref:Uncharacterized protein n=1 Tax=Monoraphidium neglectum TaxID=145388 RepID=A0A0D2N9X3_9CHLO|nr:hypothetical protein MNEG_5543 [Monoraphidium neglectum]KIZ02411.1 hypothetical protein MNEG_5543 [Monoraphidium neglectum]|eukprot:XP_013901430.1 hypothetical protein MNEG_5543 [Monoraphidium neglectum]
MLLGGGASSGLWVYVIDTSEDARSEDLSPNRGRFALSCVRAVSRAALALPHAPDDAAVICAGRAPRVLVPPGAEDGGLLFADPWQHGSATAGDSFELLPALRLALLLCRQRVGTAQPLQQQQQRHQQQQQQQQPRPQRQSPEAGRVVVFVNSGVRVRDAEAGAAVAAFNAVAGTGGCDGGVIGLDIVLLGGASEEVDAASMRCLRHIVDALNGSSTDKGPRASNHSGGSGSSSSSSSTCTSGCSRIGSALGSAPAEDAHIPCCSNSCSSSSSSSSSAGAGAPHDAAAATPVPRRRHLQQPQHQRPQRRRHVRARLVDFGTAPPSLLMWQQVELLMELLELPTYEQLGGGAEPETPDHPGPARARGHAGPAGGDAAARPAAAAPHQLGGPAATGVAHHHPHPSSAARLATRLRQRLLGPSLFSSRALRPCRCRHESLDSLHHLSHDGFMHSWLPSYANPAKVRPDSVI